MKYKRIFKTCKLMNLCDINIILAPFNSQSHSQHIYILYNPIPPPVQKWPTKGSTIWIIRMWRCDSKLWQAMLFYIVWGPQIWKQNWNIIRIDEVRCFEISPVEDMQNIRKILLLYFCISGFVAMEKYNKTWIRGNIREFYGHLFLWIYMIQT